MAKTIEQIQEEVQQIKNETVAKQNTATRVGGALEDIVDHVEHYISDVVDKGVAEAVAAVEAKAQSIDKLTGDVDTLSSKVGEFKYEMRGTMVDLAKGDSLAIYDDESEFKKGQVQSNGYINTTKNNTCYSPIISARQGEEKKYLSFNNTLFKVDVLYYANEDGGTATAETGFLSNINRLQLVNNIYVRFNVRKIDETDLTDSDLMQISETVRVFVSVNNLLAKKTDVAVAESNAVALAKEYTDSITNNFVAKTVGKNMFNKDSKGIVSGKYIDYSTGRAGTNAVYEYQYIDVVGGITLSMNPFSYFQVAFFDSSDKYISGLNNKDCETFLTPNTAVKMSVSYPSEKRDLIQIEKGSSHTDYEPYKVGIDGNMITAGSVDESKLSDSVRNTLSKFDKINVIEVDVNGSGQYTSLRDAIESITDASKSNKYEIHIKEGTYDIKSYYTDAEWAVENASFVGLKVPDYTTLIGVGNRENVILTASDSTQRNYISTLNLSNTSGLKNLSVKADGLRYTIHDDFATTGGTGYDRVVENCYFYGKNLKLNYTYGCGIKQGANFIFKNCIFETVGAIPGLLIHNNTGWSIESYIRIENCRFIPYDKSYNNNKGVLLSSLGTGSKFTYVTAIGNIMRRFELNENNVPLYGRGNMFKLTGYANKFVHAGSSAGEDDVYINTTDGVDYSSYIDLVKF